MSETTPNPGPRQHPGYVYFLRSGSHVKIGWSRKPRERIRHLQTANPVTVELIGAITATKESEAHLHELFSQYWERGEWFRCAPVVLKHIDWLCEDECERNSYRLFLGRAQAAAAEAASSALQVLTVVGHGTCEDQEQLHEHVLKLAVESMRSRRWIQ